MCPKATSTIRSGSVIVLLAGLHGRQRAVIDADADRHALRLREPDDFLHLRPLADVAGIEAQFRDARIERGNRHLIMEVDIRDDRHGRARDDLRHHRRRFLVRHGDADDLAAVRGEIVNLLDRRLLVARVRRAHRLDDDRRAAADLDGVSLAVVEEDRAA